MQKIDNASFKPLNNPLSRRDWLEVAEYTSLVVAAVGSLVSGLSGQIFYAAAPLTLTASLNLLNRQRFEQQLRQNTSSAIADVHTVVHSLKQDIQTLPPPPPASPTGELDAMLSDLHKKLRSWEKAGFNQLDWETLNVRFLLIEEKLTQIKSSVTDVQQRIGESFNGGELPVLPSQPPLDLTALQTRLELLQQQVGRLQRQNREIVKPYLQRLTREIKQLSAS